MMARANTEAGKQEREVAFKDVKLAGGTPSFVELRQILDNEIRIEYTSKASDKGINFARRGGDFGGLPFEATRSGAV